MNGEAQPEHKTAKERGIEHAKDGYKNAQEVIRFVDTKTGVIVGFSLLAVAFILQIVKEFFGLPEPVRSEILGVFTIHREYWNGILTISGMSLLMGVISLFSGIMALTARPPHIQSTRPQTILFPFFKNDSESITAAKGYLRKIQSGIQEDVLAAEYETQILNVGLILCQKVGWCRKCANCFLMQIIFIAIAGIMFLGWFWWKKAPYSEPQVKAISTISNTVIPHPMIHAPNNPKP